AKIVKLGLDEMTAQQVITHVVRDRLKSELKLRRWKRRSDSLMDAHRTMRQLHPGANAIERIHKPEPNLFLEQYFSQGRPVVLTGIFDHWPALRKWSPDFLRQTY